MGRGAQEESQQRVQSRVVQWKQIFRGELIENGVVAFGIEFVPTR